MIVRRCRILLLFEELLQGRGLRGRLPGDQCHAAHRQGPRDRTLLGFRNRLRAAVTLEGHRPAGIDQTENAILLRHQRGYSEQQADPEPNPLRARPGALGRRAFARRRAIEAAQFGASHLYHVPIVGPRYSIGRNSGKTLTETRQEFKIRHPRRGCRRGPHPCAYCFAPTSTSGTFDSRVTRPLVPRPATLCRRLILRQSRAQFSSRRMRPRLITRLSRKCQIRACAAKRGLPPIPAFGIGWLYPVCLRLILRQSRAQFSSRRMRPRRITRLTPQAKPQRRKFQCRKMSSGREFQHLRN